jgi:uncharacterized protein
VTGMYRKPADLPRIIPVFPLSGAILFPRGQLPLNIFEPRYLNMTDDALGTERLIGMIQPDGSGGGEKPGLSHVGCVGRLTSFAETDDGRYLITLSGISRFRMLREVPVRTPYRQVEADFEPFAADLKLPAQPLSFRRDTLLEVIRAYFARNELKSDWDALEQAPPEILINALSALCPFEPIEKQALLEAEDLDARLAALMALMRMDGASDSQGPLQ